MKFFLCVSGKIGTGKSTVSKFFRDKGFTYINMDEIGHEVFERKRYEINKVFNTTDRNEISYIVFNDLEKLRILESILHPEMKKILSEKTNRNLKYVIEAAIKKRLNLDCDINLTVISEKNVIFDRLIKRGLELEKIEKILKAQEDITPEGIVIDNSYTLDVLYKKLEFIYSFLKKSFNF